MANPNSVRIYGPGGRSTATLLGNVGASSIADALHKAAPDLGDVGIIDAYLGRRGIDNLTEAIGPKVERYFTFCTRRIRLPNGGVRTVTAFARVLAVIALGIGATTLFMNRRPDEAQTV